MNFEKLYFKLPYFAQTIILNIKGFIIMRNRYNKDFWKVLSIFKNRKREVVDIQQLRRFLQNANASSFWNRRFNEYDVKLDAEDIIRELKKLPVLTKDEVKRNSDTIRVNVEKDKIGTIKTSGTTGSGLIFTQTLSMENKQWAVWWRYREENGIDFNETCAWFGGRSIIRLEKKNPPFWHINHFMKQIMFSAYHLNENTVKFYFDYIKKKRIKWLHGYPSQISFFASLVRDENLGKIESVKYITFGGENVLDSQIEMINQVFDARLTQHYGLAEGVANISQNKEGELVPDQDFCFTEFVQIGNTSSYKIIGTNYNNFSFPLIRYDTNDIASINNKRIISIDGRNEDYLVLPNGIKLGRLDHIFKSAINIIEAQIYQPNISSLILRVVKGKDYSPKDEIDLISEARLRIPEEVSIKINYLSKIKKTKSGKLKFVISDVK